MPRNNRSRRKRQQPKVRHPESVRPTNVRRGRPAKVECVQVRSQLRQEPDVRRIARAVIRLALDEARARQHRDEAEARS